MSKDSFVSRPFRPPPPGISPNFVNPPTRAPMLLAVTSIAWLISTFFVLCRCYTRCVLTRIFGASDYMLLVAYAFAVVNSSLVIAGVRWGLGRHSWDVPLGWFFPHLLRNIWIQRKTYSLSLAFSKIAILLVYPQMNPSRTFRHCVWTLVVIVVLTTLAAILLDLFLCSPISAAWDFQTALHHPCKSHLSYIVLSGASNITTDLAILVLPIFMLRNVVLSRKKKIAVVLVLATGSLASLISLVRWIMSFRLTHDKDLSDAILTLVLWSDIEIHAGLICASLPMLKPLIRRIIPSLAWDTSANGSSVGRSDVNVMDERGRMVRHELKEFKRMTIVGDGGAESRDNVSEQHILSDNDSLPKSPMC